VSSPASPTFSAQERATPSSPAAGAPRSRLLAPLRLLARSPIFRLSLGLVALMIVVVLVNNEHLSRKVLETDVVKSTEAAVLTTLDVLQFTYEQQGIDGVRAELNRRFSADSRIVHHLRDPEGRVVSSSIGNLDPKDAAHIAYEARRLLPPVGVGTGTQIVVQDDSDDEQGVGLVYRSLLFPDGHEVVIGMNTAYLRESLFAHKHTVHLIEHVTVVIACFALLAVVYLVFRLNRIATATRQIIDTGNLSQRIPVGRQRDDFAQLAGLLNTMLDRIEDQMSSVRRVADNLAHDLRTPLTRLRNRIESLREQPTVSAETVEQLTTEADNLLGVFSALLHIANVEQGRRSLDFAPVKLDALLADLADVYEPLATEKGQRCEVSSVPVTIAGERHLLFQALANLVDNAIKFSPPGARISVAMERSGGEVRLVVTDTGPGIPAGMEERVFERFFRLEQSRHTPGNGLGLSLARAVVQLHGGRIALEPNQPGLRVVITLPVGAA
jgi:signal transduction histidine kinase